MKRLLGIAAATGLCMLPLVGCGTDATQPPASEPRIESSVNDTRQTVYAENQYAINIGDQREVAGAAAEIFVGKVDSMVGSKTLSMLPATQFRVSVLNSLKGTVAGSVTVSQDGGTDPKTNRVILLDGDKLIEVGKSYVFATTKNQENGWYTISAVTGHTELSTSDAKSLSPNSRTAAPAAVSEWQRSIQNQIAPK